jgi:hypothetical protein
MNDIEAVILRSVATKNLTRYSRFFASFRITPFLFLTASNAYATLMTANSLQIMRTLVASTGQPPQVAGGLALDQIVAPPVGSYIPRSLFYSHGIPNNVYAQGGGVHLTVPDNSVPADFYLRVKVPWPELAQLHGRRQ